MKNVCKAARRAVFASLAILLLVMGLAPAMMPVSALNGVATASPVSYTHLTLPTSDLV